MFCTETVKMPNSPAQKLACMMKQTAVQDRVTRRSARVSSLAVAEEPHSKKKRKSQLSTANDQDNQSLPTAKEFPRENSKKSGERKQKTLENTKAQEVNNNCNASEESGMRRVSKRRSAVKSKTYKEPASSDESYHDSASDLTEISVTKKRQTPTIKRMSQKRTGNLDKTFQKPGGNEESFDSGQEFSEKSDTKKSRTSVANQKPKKIKDKLPRMRKESTSSDESSSDSDSDFVMKKRKVSAIKRKAKGRKEKSSNLSVLGVKSHNCKTCNVPKVNIEDFKVKSKPVKNVRKDEAVVASTSSSEKHVKSEGDISSSDDSDTWEEVEG